MQNDQSNTLKILMAAPLPPPDHGGIATWSRIVKEYFSNQPDVELKFIDITARYRSAITHSLALRLVGGSIQALRDTWRIYRQLRKFKPHLLHLTTSSGPASLKDLLIVSICKRFGVGSIIHYRMGRLPNIFAQAGVEYKLISAAMRLADAVIPLDMNSESCIKSALPEVNVFKLPNMVEINAIDQIRKNNTILPNSDSRLRIVFAGHIIPKKGLRELVSACSKLTPGSFVLDIIGPVNNKFHHELLNIASASGKFDWFRFLGPLPHDEVIQHIACADIFVLPSYTEGMPNVVLEAMGCGRAILATTVGAIPEMLDIGGPNECGVCVPPQNADAIFEALERLIGDAELRWSLEQLSRKRAEELYSVPVACGKLFDLWRTTAQSNSAKYPEKHQSSTVSDKAGKS